MSEEIQGQPEKVPHDSGNEDYKVGYGKPPLETRFKPGNPGSAGRKTAGATVDEWWNYLSAQNPTEDELRKIARDKKADWNRRSAANQMLRTLECPDIADYAGLLRGENRLEDLRAMGVNTEVVKKFKQKTRTTTARDGTGEVEEVVDREIEFYDRSGESLDRVCDRTNGKPNQSMDVKMQTSHKEETHRTMNAVLSDPAAYNAAVLIAEKANGGIAEPKPD